MVAQSVDWLLLGAADCQAFMVKGQKFLIARLHEGVRIHGQERVTEYRLDK